jgi:hypothetical protein
MSGIYVTTEKKQLAGFFYIYFCTNVSAYYAEPQATQSEDLDCAYTIKKVRRDVTNQTLPGRE